MAQENAFRFWLTLELINCAKGLKSTLRPCYKVSKAQSIVRQLLNFMAIGLYELSYAVAYITFALGILSSFARFYSRASVVKSWDATIRRLAPSW